MEKKQILQEALRHLNSYIRQEKHLTEDADYFSMASGVHVNADVLKMHIGGGEQAAEAVSDYSVYIQTWAPQKDINTIITLMRSLPKPAVLFADFVNPVMAEKLRRRSIEFVDCAGNMNIKSGGVSAYIKGRRLPQLRSKRARGRAFNSAGLKLIFAVFNRPEFLQASYRDISRKVNIALGSVGPVMNDLNLSGYILDEDGKRLVNKRRLFERWVDGYLEKLRPKQIMACYTCDDEDWWKKADPFEFYGVWGGEVVVAKSTPFMVPETISLYFLSDVKQKKFAEKYGLREDEEGEICVYKKFWSPSYAGDDNEDGISPMIVYADIVDSINPGSWDVAKTFYGEAVAGLLED